MEYISRNLRARIVRVLGSVMHFLAQLWLSRAVVLF
jgi:hypothetical protein